MEEKSNDAGLVLRDVVHGRSIDFNDPDFNRRRAERVQASIAALRAKQQASLKAVSTENVAGSENAESK
jgi:hypothetical protein